MHRHSNNRRSSHRFASWGAAAALALSALIFAPAVGAQDGGYDGGTTGEPTTTIATGGRQLEECPESAAGLTLVSGELAPGGDIVVSGEGFAPDADLNLYVCSTPVLIGTAVADADGRVEGGGTIPTNLEAGVHYIIAYGLDSDGNPLTLGLEFGEESATTTTAPPSSPDDTAPATTAAIAVTPVTAATTGETAAVGGTAQAPATGALGNTGTSAGTVATIAAAVVLLGSALVLGARRRRQG